MAKEREKQSFGSSHRYSSDDASIDLFDSVKKLAESDIQKEYMTYDEFLFKLRRWWCQHYKRPYKDPLLDTYTFEELLFEYYDVTKEFNRKPEEVKVSEEVEAEDRAWAEEEDAREAAEAEAADALALDGEAPPPEGDIIVEEAVGLTDDVWAKKHEPQKVLTNPSADQVDDEDGDISASFEG